MKRNKRKQNLPLIQIITASLLLHILVGVILGGYVIATNFTKQEQELEPPPQIQRIQPQKLQYKVQMQQQQKQSATPRQQRIQAKAPTDISIPDISISLPNISADVAIGTGAGGAAGAGLGSGGGALEMGKIAVNFFGIQNSGEKIYFIIEADKRMLEDNKGGYPAYDIIKREVSTMVEKLPNGILFNSALYSGGKLISFADSIAPVYAGVKEKVASWLEPINKTYSGAGSLPGSDVELTNKTILPMKHTPSNWVKSLQRALEDQADTVFLMVSGWNWHGMGLSEEEYKQWLLREHRWGEKEEAQWLKDVEAAKAELAKQNAERVKKGVPERVVHWIGTIVAEMGNRTKPSPSWTEEQVADHIRNVVEEYYVKQDRQKPSINVVIFIGKGEAKEKKDEIKKIEDRFKSIVREGRSGRIKILEGMEDLQRVVAMK